MSDLQNYIRTRKASAPAFAGDYDAGYQSFTAGAVAQQLYTQASERLQTRPTATLQIGGQRLAYG